MKETEKRIESKISRTAEFTCISRAASFYEKTPEYRSNDFIATKLVPRYLTPLIKNRVIKNLLMNRFFAKGTYEYVIARTKYIDSIFQKAILSGFDQILLFGAGFDSRGIRFASANTKTRIFEMDVPITQDAKIRQLKKRHIEIGPSIIFIPIDFSRESLEDRLLESGFKKNQKSLFILEGLLMYLNKETVDATFHVIDGFAGDGSEVVFDYVYSSVLREENLYYGETEVYQLVKKENEPWCFGIEKGAIESFLEQRNLRLIENLHSEDLEKKFFTDERGNTVGRINGTHCIAYARK